MSTKYTTILWDMDNTLLDFEYSMTKALHACFQAYGEVLTDEMLKRYEQINSAWWKRLEKGEVTKAQLLNGRFIEFFSEYNISHIDVEEFRKLFQIELGKNYSYIENSLEVCTKLHQDVKQYVVTNGVLETQAIKIKASGFGNVMDGVFVSGEIGYEKPRREYFDKCLENIEEKDLRKILIIGDSLSSDITGGNNAGIDTCWFNPGSKKISEEYKNIRIDHEIHHLEEVFEVIYG